MSKPKVKLQSTALGQNLDDTEQALLTAGAPLYQAGGNLVHIVRLDHEGGELVIRSVATQRVLELMLRAADFLRYESNKWIPAAPTLPFVQSYVARGEWKLRPLRGIIEAPTLRPDGSVLSEPGYDPQMMVYLDTGGVEFPPVPDTPSKDEALAALATLKDVIKDFPFVPDEEPDEFGGVVSSARSVALSALLTGVSRKALRTAPAHAIDATAAVTGKSLLCDVVAMFATGRCAVATSTGRNTEEFNKRLFATLRKGGPVVMIDNVDRELESDEFCTVLTSTEWGNRVLGESETRTVSTVVLFLVNGNNIRFKGDLTTRVVVCRMDAGMENPGARTFDRDLRVYVPENRPRLVVAALTVLRAFVIAGRPGLAELKPFARFEDWSNLVRGALVWLGEPDPLNTREAIVAIDSERENLAALHQGWAEVIGLDQWVTAKQVIEASEQRSDRNLGIVGGEALAGALDDLDGLLTPVTLGKYLVSFDGRIVEGRCLRKRSTVGHSTRFCLEEAGHEAGQPASLSP
ncbi:MAG: hypothetical protein HY834_14800 [Devosia nanyangense]|uniref:DUF927 domain-containing protein n=1 Tax=Devosia nanyangense TaxID=1228055 RepID=A0A933L3L3_9HYPH|nr:hypothetical protein [Devosia nanyangense]